MAGARPSDVAGRVPPDQVQRGEALHLVRRLRRRRLPPALAVSARCPLARREEPPVSRLRVDPVEVQRRDDLPAQFLWRGRIYLVREVLSRWTESGGWWRSAGVLALSAGEGSAGAGSAGASAEVDPLALLPAGRSRRSGHEPAGTARTAGRSGPVGSGAVGSGAVGPGAVGSGAVGSGAVGSGAVGPGAVDALGPVSGVDDDEQDWFRVEAGCPPTSGPSSGGTGVFDLCFSWSSGRWTLARVLD